MFISVFHGLQERLVLLRFDCIQKDVAGPRNTLYKTQESCKKKPLMGISELLAVRSSVIIAGSGRGRRALKGNVFGLLIRLCCHQKDHCH